MIITVYIIDVNSIVYKPNITSVIIITESTHLNPVMVIINCIMIIVCGHEVLKLF